MLTFRKVDLISEVLGRPVTNYAHRADVLRLQVLEEFGGIYLDLDVVSLKPLDDLLDREFIMGQEGVGKLIRKKKGCYFYLLICLYRWICWFM
jgi:hypothetical protein